jgi:hypothetical protein
MKSLERAGDSVYGAECHLVGCRAGLLKSCNQDSDLSHHLIYNEDNLKIDPTGWGASRRSHYQQNRRTG